MQILVEFPVCNVGLEDSSDVHKNISGLRRSASTLHRYPTLKHSGYQYIIRSGFCCNKVFRTAQFCVSSLRAQRSNLIFWIASDYRPRNDVDIQ
jgi:hypothetical protein